MKRHARATALVVLSLVAGTASAHPGPHGLTGFAGGLAHPLLGLDHLLAMIAVGLWAAQQGGRALWAIPAAFVGATLAGALFAWSGWFLPQVETAVALSVLLLGLLVATRCRAPVPAGMALATGFALFHGYAHGLDVPHAASPVSYAAGFVLATALLHMAGVAASLLGRHAVRMAGIAIAATGAALLLAV